MSAGWTAVSQTQRRKFVTRMTGDQMLYQTPLYAAPGGGASMRTPGFEVKAVRQQNVSGSTAIVGLAAVVPNADWIAGWFSATGPSLTLNTAAAQNTTAGDFTLADFSNGNGFVVAAQCPFGAIGIDLSQVTAGINTPVYAVLYTQDNGAGVPQWATMPTTQLLVGPDFTASGETLVLFTEPNDFIPSISTTLTNLPAGYYAIRVVATTAPTTAAALATLLTVGRPFSLTKNVANNTVVETFTSQEFDPEASGLRRFCPQLAAIFTVATDHNLTELLVRPKG